jgi:hypothetical protein
MAEILRVGVEELTGPGAGDGEEGLRVYEPAAEIEQAMMGYEAVIASTGGRDPGTKATAAHPGGQSIGCVRRTRPPATMTPAGCCPR